MTFRDITDIQLEEYQLANSMRLLAHPDSANPIICLQLYIKTGSVNESSQQYGFSHFLEHLVFKSTRKYPDNQISSVSSSLGFVLNAYTDFDTTCYYLMLPKERLSEAMDILVEMACYANFSEMDVQGEKDIIIEEINQYECEPEMSFIEYIQATSFLKSPLNHPVLGTIATVSKASTRALQAFYHQHYRPSNAFMVACGDFDPDLLFRLFSSAFSNWQDAEMSSRDFLIKKHNAFRFHNLEKQGPELLAFVLPELAEKHPDSEALHIAIRHLAIGKSSLLHKELVERRKLCSFVKVSSISGLISGVSVILLAPTKPSNKDAIIKAIFKYWAQILSHGVSSQAMQLIKKDIIHSWLYSFDGVEHKASLIANEEFNQDLGRIRGYGSLIESINGSHILEAVNKHWQASSLAVYYQGMGDYKLSEPPTLNAQKHKTSKQTTAAVILESQALDLYHQDTPQYYQYSIPGGMQFVYNYIPNRLICGFALSSPLCQLNESIAGQNYFTSALMLYGTQRHSHDELMRISRESGFNIRVQQHLDSTLFRGKSHYQDLPLVLNILAEIISYPAFDPRYFRMLKSAALDNLRREKSYPVSYAYTRWFNNVFGKDNNLLRSTGDAHDIESIRLEDCRDWHDSWHLGRDFSLCVVGSLDPEELHALVRQLFSCSSSSQAAPPHKPRYSSSKAFMQRQYKHKEQSIIHIGGYACPASNRMDNSAFHVLAQVLGGDLASRFYSILREKHGYAYQTGFDFSSIEELGFWYAYAFCDPDDYRACQKLMQDILNDVALNGISAQEMKDAQNYLVSVNRFDAESPAFKAATIANLISLGYPLDYHLQREQRIRSITLDQIQTLAAKWLKPDNQYTHIMV